MEELLVPMLRNKYDINLTVKNKNHLEKFNKIIKKNFPTVTTITPEEYELISAKIVEQLKAGQKVTAVEKLFDKTLRSLTHLASFYVNNNINPKNFEEDLNGLQFFLVQELTDKVNVQKNWYFSYKSFYHRMIACTQLYLTDICRRIEIEKNIQQLDNNSIELVCNEFYNKLLDEVTNKELKVKLEKSFKKLTPKEEIVILKRIFDGLKFNQISKKYNISTQRICQIFQRALRKIQNSNNDLKEFL